MKRTTKIITTLIVIITAAICIESDAQTVGKNRLSKQPTNVPKGYLDGDIVQVKELIGSQGSGGGIYSFRGDPLPSQNHPQSRKSGLTNNQRADRTRARLPGPSSSKRFTASDFARWKTGKKAGAQTGDSNRQRASVDCGDVVVVKELDASVVERTPRSNQSDAQRVIEKLERGLREDVKPIKSQNRDDRKANNQRKNRGPSRSTAKSRSSKSSNAKKSSGGKSSKKSKGRSNRRTKR